MPSLPSPPVSRTTRLLNASRLCCCCCFWRRRRRLRPALEIPGRRLSLAALPPPPHPRLRPSRSQRRHGRGPYKASSQRSGAGQCGAGRGGAGGVAGPEEPSGPLLRSSGRLSGSPARRPRSARWAAPGASVRRGEALLLLRLRLGSACWAPSVPRDEAQQQPPRLGSRGAAKPEEAGPPRRHDRGAPAAAAEATRAPPGPPPDTCAASSGPGAPRCSAAPRSAVRRGPSESPPKAVLAGAPLLALAGAAAWGRPMARRDSGGARRRRSAVSSASC